MVGLAELLQDVRRHAYAARAADIACHLRHCHAAFTPPQLIVLCQIRRAELSTGFCLSDS